MSNIEMVENIFREIFMVEENDSVEDKNVLNLENWNSYEQFTFISALEEKFSISIDIADILKMTSYKKIIDILQKYISL